MESKQPLLSEMDINLEVLDIELDPIEITLSPLPEIKLTPIDVDLKPLPINLDNTLFDGLELTSFEDLGDLVQ